MIRTVAWMETRSFLRNWRNLATVVVLPLLFVLVSFRFASVVESDLSANWVLGVSAVLVVWSTSVTIAARVFLHEKVEYALASILASPISVAELLVGKAASVLLLTYLALLIGVIATVCALSVSTGVLPDVCTFTMALLAVPAWGLVAAEVIGILCLLVGSSTFVVPTSMFPALGSLAWIAGIRTATSSIWVFLALAVVGLAIAVAVPVPFSKIGKPRLAR